MQRIAVIGNAGGGKTTLSRLLGEALGLPVHHVDSIQYQPGWKRSASAECDRRLDEVAASEFWIIDGFGSDGAIERRLRAADTVVFVDFPCAAYRQPFRERRGAAVRNRRPRGRNRLASRKLGR